MSRSFSTISSRIASRINPVRESAVNPSARFVTKFEGFSNNQLVALVAVPSAVFFLGSFLLPTNNVIGWRFVAHVAPYRLPSLVETGLWRTSLVALSDPDLTCAEISQLLANIEIVTQRKLAVRTISKEATDLNLFTPIFNQLNTTSSQSNFETSLRIVMDVVSATPARNRKVDSTVLESLWAPSTSWWTSDRDSDTMRFAEYRLLLILKLLQNEKNLQVAKKSSEFQFFLTQQNFQHIPFPSLPLLPILYQFKTEKLGFETFDIVRKIRTMMGISSENLNFRKSFSLAEKLDFINYEKLVYLTICYASIRILPMISEYTFPVLKSAAGVMAKAILGVTILDLWYRAEEHVIQSKMYWENHGTVLGPAVMVATHCAGLALILKRFPFCFAPFIVTKLVREAFADSYRFT